MNYWKDHFDSNIINCFSCGQRFDLDKAINFNNISYNFEQCCESGLDHFNINCSMFSKNVCFNFSHKDKTYSVLKYNGFIEIYIVDCELMSLGSNIERGDYVELPQVVDSAIDFKNFSIDVFLEKLNLIRTFA